MVGNHRLMTSVLQRIFYAVRLAMAVAIGAVSLPAQADNAIPMFIGDDGYLSQTVEGICVPAHSPKTMSTGWGEYDVVGSKVSGPNSCELSLVVRVPSEWSSPRTLTRGWPVYTQLACPDGSLTPDNICTPRPPVQACTVAYPVIPGTGTKILVENDSASAELPLTRAYRSYVTFGINAGTGKWLFNWQRALDTNIARFSTPQVSAWRDDGSILYFQKNGAVWSTASSSDTLQAVIDGNGATTGWLYKVGQTGVVETYDADGRLQSVRERNGRTTQLAYDTSKRLATVTAPSGRALTFAYDASGRVATVTAPDGAVTKYAYNASGMLTTVTWPDNNNRQYVYENTRFPTALTGVIDEAGVRYTTYAYDDRGRAISSEVTPSSDRYQFQYPSNGQTIVTLPSGTTSTYTFLQQNGVLLPTAVSAPCPTCGSTAQSTSYDANNNPTSKTGYDGSTTSYTYDGLGRETQRVEGAGTANAKTTTTEWDPQQGLAARIAAPNKLEAFSYDANGNLLSHTVTPTSDSSGSQGFGAVASAPIQRTDWTYDDSGHVLTATERTDGTVTGTWTLTYDGQGKLQTLTNPDGKTGRIKLYDAAGRVLEAVDVNGVALKFGYNARGWLTDYDIGEQHIRYEYDAVGHRVAMVGPQNLVMRYVYDAAHRLTEILANITSLPEDGQSSAASPFGTTQAESKTAQPTVLQALRTMTVRLWNGLLNTIKQWLSSIIQSAHAQVPPGGGALSTIYLPSPPVPGGSTNVNWPQYPEQILDINSRDHVRPDLRTRVIRALQRIGNALCRGGDTSREECQKECDDQLERDEAECLVAKAGYGTKAQALCLGKAKEYYGQCIKNCSGK